MPKGVPEKPNDGNSSPEPAGSSQKSRDALKQRTREVADDFAFSTLLSGVASRPEAVVTAPPEPPREPEPVPSPPKPTGAIIAAVVVVVLVLALAGWKLLSRPASEAPAGPAVTPSAPSPTASTPAAPPAEAALRVRLPIGPAAAGDGAQVQEPVFILSDFEVAQGKWQPARNLPSCRNAFVARVRDRAQQGNYWLKMDRVSMGPGAAQDSAFTIKPDSSDLSHHGTIVSAAVFVPQNAPEGMKAELGIEDSHGSQHMQGGGEPLTGGKWTLVEWPAGDLLQDVSRLAVLVHGGGKSYNGFIGLDNVQLRHAAAPPELSGLTASATEEGRVRIGDATHVETEVGVAVCGTNGEIARETPDKAHSKVGADGVVSLGTIAVPGAPDATVSVRANVKPEYSRALSVDVEAVAKKKARVQGVVADILLPRELYGNAYVDVTSGKGISPTGTHALLAANGEEVHVAGDYPIGFSVRADKPLPLLVKEELIPTSFSYTSSKPLTSVHLAGVFNGWNTTATSMQSADGRTWQTTVPMAPGEQQYKLILNGNEWTTDPHSSKDVRDAQGNMNSVRFVPRPPGSTDAFHLWVVLAGNADGTPVNLEAGQTIHGSFKLTFNQPFKNGLARSER